MKAFFFCIFLLCVCLCAVRVQSLCCGQVFDGPVYLKDIDASRSHHRVFASWSGFPDPTGKCVVGTSTGKIPALSKLGPSPGLQGITGRARSGTGAFGKKKFTTPGVTYQVAVISQAMATTAIRSSGANATAFSPRCRIGSGINHAKPDTVDWQFTETQNTFINMSVKLYPGVTYYTIVRAHIQGTTGRTVYSNSNGFVVLPYHGADDDDGENDNDSNDDDGGDDDDDGNSNDDGNDADDDGLAPYQSGLIAMGCALFCLLLLCCLLLLVFFTRKGEDKYTTTVHRNENVDKL